MMVCTHLNGAWHSGRQATMVTCACGQNALCQTCGFGWGIIPCDCASEMMPMVSKLMAGSNLGYRQSRTMIVLPPSNEAGPPWEWHMTNNPKLLAEIYQGPHAES